MRVGYTISPASFPNAAAVVALASELDAAGAPLICVNEAETDCFTLLAAMAGRTRQALLGTAIATTFLRHPWEMARLAAGIDSLSGGRLFLGLGSGRQDTVERRLGGSYDRPVSRTRDYLTVLRACLEREQGPIDVETATYQNRGAALTWPPRRHIPIMLAALGDPMARLAATHADGMFTTFAATRQFPRWRALLDDAARGAGRDPAGISICAIRLACVRDDRAEAITLVRGAIEAWPPSRLYLQQFAVQGLLPSAELTDAAVGQMALAGTADDIRRQLRDLAAAGVGVVVMNVPGGIADQAAEFRRLASVGLHSELTLNG